MANCLYILAMVIAMPVEIVSCASSQEISSFASKASPHLPPVSPHRIVCSRAIPSLIALQDARFESITCMFRAPAIAPGEVVTGDHVRNAEKEVEVRKKIKLTSAMLGGATESEVNDAKARLHTVTQEWTKTKYPYTTPSPTGSEQFYDLFHDLNSRIDKASQDAAEDRRTAAAAAEAAATAADADRRAAAAAAAEATVAAAAADRQVAAAAAAAFAAAAAAAATDRAEAAADRLAIRVLIAKSDNRFLRAKNQQALIDVAAHGNGQQQALFPLLKERQGAGLALPGSGYAVAAAPDPVGLGVAVGAPFPDTVQLLSDLTRVQLSTLAILFNDHFGIVAADSLNGRRAKFQAYIAGM
jgi:hypothetical protein